MSSLDSTPAARAHDLEDHLPRLVRTVGDGVGEIFLLEKDAIAIGRSQESNDLILDDEEISRSHAHLTRLPGGDWQIEDHSSNGSYLDGVRVQKAILRDRVRLSFGSGLKSAFLFLDRPREETASAGRPAVAVRTVQLGGEPPEALPTRLQLVLDDHAVRDIPLIPGTMILGSRPGVNGVAIDSVLIAGKHAALDVARNGEATVRDLSDGGGVYVNGVLVAEKRLAEGDLIQLGACQTHLLLFRDTGVRRRTLGEFDLTKRIVAIGRAPDNDVTLAHPTVSSHHAEIRHLASGEIELVDLGSANGSFVNGIRVERTILNAHDRIALGAMELVFDGLQLEREADGKSISVYAENLRKVVKDNLGRRIVLLDDVSIVLKPNEFVGLLGPSGAGKSTLMDAMNGFRPVEGQVRMNERSLYQYPQLLRQLIGYLPQDDILHTRLTVRQCLTFSARLRMPSDHTAGEIHAQVDKVLHTLRLTERGDKVIETLSGGERKRVSLGIELLSDPAVLYVDEPTAGQDPATEMQMMQLFRNLANRGSTVVINTHLLGSFSLLDKVAVLARGKLVFYGPATGMLGYFDCKRPIEVYYKLAPPGVSRDEEEQIAEDWRQRYLSSDAYRDHVAAPLAEARAHGQAAQADGDARQKPSTSWMTQVKTLLARQIALRMGDGNSVATLVLPPALIGVLLCFMADQPNQPMTLLITILTAMWFACSGNVREIVDEWAIYRRERQRSLRRDAYLASRIVYLIGLSGVQTLTFILILSLGGALSGHLLGAWGLMWIMGIQGGLIGLLISAIASTSERALYTFPLVMIPELLLAGLLIPVHSTAPAANVSAVPGLVMQLPYEGGRQMNGFLADGLSPLMVSRWGLEAMRDLYVHDAIARPLHGGYAETIALAAKAGVTSIPSALRPPADYRYPLLSSISSTFHPNDMRDALRPLPPLAGEEACRYNFFAAANLPGKDALPQYLSIQGLFLLGMIGTIWLTVRRREGRS
ncbi:ABC-type multidrug transport system, ATPase component [Granulicella rosea]|uniref:ABC-type multidrug transport system, ATPase component n=1 Tax=Granulicella rosea TaxID=474952 RepID=A0A239KND4_9BACT|nr:FHA domain-containing protein [Granulicella rosea]SNT19540.1 ABC-type multidrug transport system, ATPase component [Granulicella rosea]